MQSNEMLQNIEPLLEAAVQLSWTELSRWSKCDSIHLEYRCAPDGKLDRVEIWSCMRKGSQLLACTYSLPDARSTEGEVQFENGCKSDGLGATLGLLMSHQLIFALPQPFGGRGLLQIGPPTDQQLDAAASSIRNALSGLTSSTVLKDAPSPSRSAVVDSQAVA